MRRSIYVIAAIIFCTLLAIQFTSYQVYAGSKGKRDDNKHNSRHKPKHTPKPTQKPTPLPTPVPNDCSEVENALETCNENLNACLNDLSECEAKPVFKLPGDGYSDPDDFGVSGHGNALSYTDNGDGTFTDNNTGLMWEQKDNANGIHDKDNTYTWTVLTDGNDTNSDGTLFTEFLEVLNNKCDGDEATTCATDAECTGIGNGLCGHAGFKDWRIPNVKELQTIVDYSTFGPSSKLPGETTASYYWTGTTGALAANGAWLISFQNGAIGGFLNVDVKTSSNYVRAVRP